jgi:hypothetical protein
MVPERRRSMIVSIAAVVLVVVVGLILARQGATAGVSQTPTIDASSSAPASVEPSQGLESASPTTEPSPTPTPSPTSSAAVLTGTWFGTWTVASPATSTGGLRVTWTQAGNALTGTMVIGTSTCPPGGAVEGTVTGDHVAFTIPGTEPVAFTGTLSGTKIEGSFSRPCDTSTGTFSLYQTP